VTVGRIAQSSMCGMAGLKLNSLVKSHVLV
jgi:hypothetical protein